MWDEAMAFLGAATVFGIQVVAVCGGLDILLTRWPQLQIALQCLGVGCLLYLGRRLLRPRLAGSGNGGELITFWEAASRRYLDPQSWLMSLAAATLLLPLQLEQVLADGYVGTI
jgi:threonine/homoserine/homoserine lactone efflux protein